MKIGLALMFSGLFVATWCLGTMNQRLPTVHYDEWAEMNASKPKQETKKWFKDAKFGMFVHWGIYSNTGGIWDGQKIHAMRRPHVTEWIQHAAEVPRDEYAELAKSFYPIPFDADEIVSLAKRAGMKYVVQITKQHDGFAMYDSKVSEFDIMDATPFKRDIVREMYEACKRQGLEFGVYYSHNIDWADGSDSRYAEYKEKGWKIGTRNLAAGANTWDPSPNTFQEYLDNKAYPQVAELLTNYPDMKCLWLDVCWRMDAEQSFKFYKIAYEIQPQVIINQRIGNGYGDYWIPGDNVIPENPEEITRPWETVGTFNNSWGFNSYDQDWKSPREILFWLIEVVSKGGNYMLNIGPTGLGGVPRESVDNLEAVGAWLEHNGEAVYGTDRWTITKEGPTKIEMAGTVAREKHGFQMKFTEEDFWFTQKGSTLYAISLVPPGKNATVKAFGSEIGRVKSAQILGHGKVRFTQSQDGLEVTIPNGFNPELGYTIKVEL